MKKVRELIGIVKANTIISEDDYEPLWDNSIKPFKPYDYDEFESIEDCVDFLNKTMKSRMDAFVKQSKSYGKFQKAVFNALQMLNHIDASSEIIKEENRTNKFIMSKQTRDALIKIIEELKIANKL